MPRTPLLILAALLLVAAPAAWAEGDPSAAERGALLYEIHCANCHGGQGRGDGRLAEVLTVRPPDLGRLTGDDGRFPVERLRRAIDGRDDVRGHGRREMPVWGLAFQQRGRDADQEAEVTGRIDDLVAFLQTLQRPASPPTP
ncbi:MAG TPA: cytochrome c [Thermoanaerobaculia bacterium]|nr:cytochrome c [Thermoanaerobaculia bacterium]